MEVPSNSVVEIFQYFNTIFYFFKCMPIIKILANYGIVALWVMDVVFSINPPFSKFMNNFDSIEFYFYFYNQ